MSGLRGIHAPKTASCSRPQLLARDPRAVDERLELRPDDARVHFLRAGKRGEAAIGACDHVLAPHDLGVTPDPLRNQLRMLDQHGGVADDAGNERLALGELRRLPYLPFVLVARIAGLERIGAGADLQRSEEHTSEL